MTDGAGVYQLDPHFAALKHGNMRSVTYDVSKETGLKVSSYISQMFRRDKQLIDIPYHFNVFGLD